MVYADDEFAKYDLSGAVGDYQLNQKLMPTKVWWKSKTIWIAIAQAVAGILFAYYYPNPTTEMAGWGVVIKSILDIYVRMRTASMIQ